jgi:hypothetical protein
LDLQTLHKCVKHGLELDTLTLESISHIAIQILKPLRILEVHIFEELGLVVLESLDISLQLFGTRLEVVFSLLQLLLHLLVQRLRLFLEFIGPHLTLFLKGLLYVANGLGD